LARVFQARKELKKAEEQAKKAVALRKDEGTLEVLASIYQEEGDNHHANHFWHAVLAQNPADREALKYLGLLPAAGDVHVSTEAVEAAKDGGETEADTEAAAVTPAGPGTVMGVTMAPHVYIPLLTFVAGGLAVAAVSCLVSWIKPTPQHKVGRGDTWRRPGRLNDRDDFEGVSLMSTADDFI